jgi:hypothetical protein
MNSCGRGCCPYPDSKVPPPFPPCHESNISQISENTRQHLLKVYWPPVYISPEDREPNSEGRTGLYWPQCMSSYRPKFICPERSCRRSIKPVYDPDRFEYDISEWQDWKVRPLLTSPEMQQVLRNWETLHAKKSVLNVEKAEFRRLRNLWYDNRYENPNLLIEEEMEFVKKYELSAWWKTIFSPSRGPYRTTENLKRCPSCGKAALRVGSNFRIPKRRDEKAWREVEGMIKAGEDMVAQFSPCATNEEWKVMVDEANAIREVYGVRNKDEVVDFTG